VRLLKILDHELKVKISPSWLDKAACPAALKFEYIDKLPRPYSIPAERGSAAHEAIAELTKLCLDMGRQPNELDDTSVEETVLKHADHRLLVELPNIVEWVKLWRDRYKLSKFLVGFEERMAIDENYNECDWKAAAYRGIVDLIDINGTHCKVTDYKSQPNILSQTDLDEHFQLTFYAWLVSKFYPFVRTFEVRIWYLRYGMMRSTPRTVMQLKDFETDLLLKVDKVMAIKDWEPIPCDYCKWCDHTGRCPVGQPDEKGDYEVIPEVILTEEQAQHYGGELRVLDERRKKLSAAIREYVKGSEDILKISSDYGYGYKESSSSYFPPDKVLKVLKDHGVDPAEHATFSATVMKKLLKTAKKEQPSLHLDLESIADTKHKTKFEGFKVK